MSSIVVELQKDSMCSEVNLSDLLRKSLVVARKLKIIEFEDWIKKELNGYGTIGETPTYREVYGEVMGLEPYSGRWIPTVVNDVEIAGSLRKTYIIQSAIEIERLVASGNGRLEMTLSQELQNSLSNLFGVQTKYKFTICPTQLNKILDSVKNIILEWSLKLEEDGIMGEGLSFSEQEKQEASKHNYNINNFNAPINGVQIQQDTANSIQNLKVGVDFQEVSKLIAQLKENMDKIGVSNDVKSQIQTEVNRVVEELNSSNPKESLVKKSLQSLKVMLEGAGAEVIALGLVAMIEKIVS